MRGFRFNVYIASSKILTHIFIYKRLTSLTLCVLYVCVFVLKLVRASTRARPTLLSKRSNTSAVYMVNVYTHIYILLNVKELIWPRTWEIVEDRQHTQYMHALLLLNACVYVLNHDVLSLCFYCFCVYFLFTIRLNERTNEQYFCSKNGVYTV